MMIVCSRFSVAFGSLVAGLIICVSQGFAQEAADEPVISPEVRADGTVTFGIRAPAAGQVSLASPGDLPMVPFGAGLEMTRGEDDVWTLEVRDVPAGAYRYVFDVDGVAVLDPANRQTSESNSNAWSLFAMPGSETMDTRQVPHGDVAEVYYESTVLGRTRRMHVYLPPGYEDGTRDYPVFYLLHGAMDSDDSWSTVGRANFILDNLIATRAAKPMIVVMPDGHTERFVRGAGRLPLDTFAQEFAADIRPHVEARFRVARGRGNTALAGLSMGGAQTLEIGMNALADFGYVGVFSSGVFGITENDEWATRHSDALNDVALRDGLKLFWFSTGRDDFLLDITEATVAMFEDKGFDVEYVESAGGHTWTNWRDYLQTFAARLF